MGELGSCARLTKFLEVDTRIVFYISGFGNKLKLDSFDVLRTQNVLTYDRNLCCLQFPDSGKRVKLVDAVSNTLFNSFLSLKLLPKSLHRRSMRNHIYSKTPLNAGDTFQQVLALNETAFNEAT